MGHLASQKERTLSVFYAIPNLEKGCLSLAYAFIINDYQTNNDNTRDSIRYPGY